MRRFRQPQAGGGGTDIGDANAWTLTSIVDAPTGVAVGDYGVLADRVYERASLTVDAGAGGGTLALWVPPDVAAWTSPTVYAYLDGDEDAVARGNRGWNTRTSGTASATGDNAGSGYTRLSAAAGSNFVVIETLVSALAAGSKVYVRAEVIASPSGTATQSQVGALVFDGTNALRAYQRGTLQSFGLVANTGTGLASDALFSGGSVLSGVSPELLEITDEGSTVLASVHRGGELYHAAKRTGGTTTANYVGWTSTTAIAPGEAWIDLRRAVIIAGT